MIHVTDRGEGHKYKEDTLRGGIGILNHEKPGDKAIGPSVKCEARNTINS